MQMNRFTIFSFFTLLIGLILCLFGYNMQVTWWVHTQGNQWADGFFALYTQAAEWLLIVLAMLLAFNISKRWGLIFFITGILQALLVWAIKFGVNAPRPASIAMENIRKIEGVKLAFWQSFPSGHTAIGFLCYAIIGLAITQQWQGNPTMGFTPQRSKKNNLTIEICLFIMAVGMGYSRMYLGQHSLLDVTIGGFIALAFFQSALICGKRWISLVEKTN